MHSWKAVSLGGCSTIVLLIVGVFLILAGLLTDPGEGETVNLHHLHIKQALYTLGGVFFIVAVINSGVNKILAALADIHSSLRNQQK